LLDKINECIEPLNEFEKNIIEPIQDNENIGDIIEDNNNILDILDVVKPSNENIKGSCVICASCKKSVNAYNTWNTFKKCYECKECNNQLMPLGAIII